MSFPENARDRENGADSGPFPDGKTRLEAQPGLNRIDVRRHSPIDTETRVVLRDPAIRLEGPWSALLDEWWRAKGGNRLPAYSDFEILNIPGAYWSNVCVTSLEGAPRRRYFVRVVGSAIEANNGLFAAGRFLGDLPFKNTRIIAREFAWTVRLGYPVYSEGPYIGVADYVKRARRLITPYRLSELEYCFVYYLNFDAHDGMEHHMRRS